jgi:6-phosphofructokinase 2
MSTAPPAPVITLTLNPALDVTTSVDRVVSRHKLRCAAPRVEAGGGGVNVARAILALGGAATPIYTAGGLPGERYRVIMHHEGMPGVPISIGGETRESLNVTDREKGQQYRFVLPGPALTGEERDRCLAAVASSLSPGGYLVMSGSLPPGTPDDFVADVARVAHAHGSACAVDVSGPALAAAVDAGVDLIKASLRELCDLTGSTLATEGEQDAALRHLLERSAVTTIIVTAGSDGATLATRAGIIRAPAFPVEERSAVGSGDAFLAAFVLRTVQGRSPLDALRAGLAAGAVMAAEVGTGGLSREWVERFERERSERPTIPS